MTQARLLHAHIAVLAGLLPPGEGMLAELAPPLRSRISREGSGGGDGDSGAQDAPVQDPAGGGPAATPPPSSPPPGGAAAAPVWRVDSPLSRPRRPDGMQPLQSPSLTRSFTFASYASGARHLREQAAAAEAAAAAHAEGAAEEDGQRGALVLTLRRIWDALPLGLALQVLPWSLGAELWCG